MVPFEISTESYERLLHAARLLPGAEGTSGLNIGSTHERLNLHEVGRDPAVIAPSSDQGRKIVVMMKELVPDTGWKTLSAKFESYREAQRRP